MIYHIPKGLREPSQCPSHSSGCSSRAFSRLRASLRGFSGFAGQPWGSVFNPGRWRGTPWQPWRGQHSLSIWRNASENGTALPGVQEKALVSPRSSGRAGISPGWATGSVWRCKMRWGKAQASWVVLISPEEGLLLSALLCGLWIVNLC